MAPWLIITGSGLDDWIYWHLLIRSLLIAIHSQSSAEPFFLDRRGLATFSFSFYDLPRCTLLYSVLWPLTILRHGPRTENTTPLLLRTCLLGLPRDRYPASPLARWLLPSIVLDVNHIENIAPVLLASCLLERVSLATGFSGSIA
jgi:hypothetical protein